MNNLNIMFIDVDYIKERSTIMNNVDEKFIATHILESQDIHIQEILGSNLYDDMVNDFLTPTNTFSQVKYRTLNENYIQPCLLYYVLYESIDDIYSKFTNKSIVTQNSDNSQVVSEQYLSKRKDDFLNKAEYYAQRLTKYLIDNYVTYDKYYKRQGTASDIEPEKTQYGHNGWFLGDVIVSDSPESIGSATDIPNIALNDLTDVIIASPSVNQILSYNGTKWVNDDVSLLFTGATQAWVTQNFLSGNTTAASLSAYTITECNANFLSANTSLFDGSYNSLTDVPNFDSMYLSANTSFYTQAQANANFLSANTAFSTALSGLTDTQISSPSLNQFLIWNGSKWANTTYNDPNSGVTQLWVTQNFLSANTSFYTQAQSNANFLSANTSFYTQSQTNSNFLSANTSLFDGSYNSLSDVPDFDSMFLSANTTLYTKAEAESSFLSANTSLFDGSYNSLSDVPDFDTMYLSANTSFYTQAQANANFLSANTAFSTYLSGLTDTSINNPQNRDFLIWNGSEWVNSAVTNQIGATEQWVTDNFLSASTVLYTKSEAESSFLSANTSLFDGSYNSLSDVPDFDSMYLSANTTLYTQAQAESSFLSANTSFYTQAQANANFLSANTSYAAAVHQHYQTSADTADYIFFNTGVTAGADKKGKLYWDTTYQTLSLNSEGGTNLQIGQENWVRIVAAENLTSGDVIYFTGSAGVYPLAAKAIATSVESSRVKGIVTETINAGNTGFTTTFGLVQGLNTSAYSVGDLCYLSASVAGSMTKTLPVAPNIQQVVAKVIVSDASVGSVYISSFANKPIGGDHIDVQRVAGSDKHSLQDLFNTGSAGQITGGVITASGSTKIVVTSGECLIAIGTIANDPLVFANFPALTATTLTDKRTSWVCVSYNSGSPIIVIYEGSSSTDYNEPAAINYQNVFPLGYVTREGSELYITNNPRRVQDAIGGVMTRFRRTLPLARDERKGGLILGETGTRNITLSGGDLYDRQNVFTITGIDTSAGGTFSTFYRSGATTDFVDTGGVTQWPNTKYDLNGVLTTVASNRFANLWWYLTTEGYLAMVYGRAIYTSAAAAAAGPIPSTLPLQLNVHARLIARTTFQGSGAAFTAIDSAFANTFGTSANASHNNLSGLQGGASGEYYHLSVAQYNNVLTRTGLTFYTTTQADANFLSANTSYYTQAQVNSGFLSANTSYYTQAQANANFLSANTAYLTTAVADTRYLSANTSFYTQAQVNSGFLSANTSFYTQAQANSSFLSANTSFYTQAQVNSGFLSASTNIIKHLSGLTDVTFTSLTTNDLIIYNGSKWVNTAATLIDVTNPTAGQVITYDGANWINSGITGTDLINYYTKTQVDTGFLSANTALFTSAQADTRYLSASTSFYTQAQVNSGFLSANTSYYTQAQVNSGFLSANTALFTSAQADTRYLSASTSFYTQAQANSSFLSANTAYLTTAVADTRYLSASTSFYTQAQANANFLSARTFEEKSFQIEFTTGISYFLTTKAPYDYDVIDISFNVDAGTANISLSGGTAGATGIVGLVGITGDTSTQTVNATSANTISAGHKLKLVVNSITSTASTLYGTIKTRR